MRWRSTSQDNLESKLGWALARLLNEETVTGCSSILLLSAKHNMLTLTVLSSQCGNSPRGPTVRIR